MRVRGCTLPAPVVCTLIPHAATPPALPSQALLSCEALLHPRALPPPAPVRCVMPAVLGRGEEDGEAPPLGMPRFWSSVDAALLLQQEQVALQQQQAAVPRQQPCTVENVPLLAAAGEEGDIEMDAVAPLPPAAAQAAAAAAVPRLQAAQPAVQPRAKVSRMAAMLAAPANAPVASLATLPVPEAATALPPALASCPSGPCGSVCCSCCAAPGCGAHGGNSGGNGGGGCRERGQRRVAA